MQKTSKALRDQRQVVLELATSESLHGVELDHSPCTWDHESHELASYVGYLGRLADGFENGAR